MISSIGSSSGRSSSSGTGSAFRTVSLLRIGAGVVLLLFHGFGGGRDAWQYVMKQQPWDMVTNLTSAALPVPGVLALAAVILAIAVGLSWSLGFVTRLFSALFLPVIAGGMIVGQRLGLPGAMEMGLLYLLITVTLLVSGSGTVSLDTLFNLGAGSRKRR